MRNYLYEKEKHCPYLFSFFIDKPLHFFSKKNNSIDKHLLNLVSTKALLSEDIKEYFITDYTKSKNNVEHYYFRQTHLGIEIIGSESSIHVLNNKIICFNNSFVKNKKLVVKSFDSNSKTPEAVISGLAWKMGYNSPSNLYRKKSFNKNNSLIYSNAGISKKDIPVKKVFFIKNNVIISGWELSIHEKLSENWWDFVINDSTGEILSKSNWKTECNPNEYNNNRTISNNYTKRGTKNKQPEQTTANNSYHVFAHPLENPNFGSWSIVTSTDNTSGSPFGWHDTNGISGAEHTVTRGNNVSAFKIENGITVQPDGGSNLIFDYPFSEVFSSSNQSVDAAITNVFYWNNIIHDILYEYGFDEESGNFQTLNYTFWYR